MLIVLIILFLLIAVLPLFVKPVEQNVEVFLLVMGIAVTLTSGMLTPGHILLIFQDQFLYIITAAVFVVSLVFRVLESHVKALVNSMLDHLPLQFIIFLLVVCLGLLSSIITAIIASLLLVEVVSILPLDRKNKTQVSVVACFSIGLGAVLTPIGEPLSTIVTSKLHQHFFYMIHLLGGYSVIGIILLGLLSAVFVDGNWRAKFSESDEVMVIPEKEDLGTIGIRTGKIFMFVVALELLGLGFKPVIDTYIIHWSNDLLYAANLMSAILDNATLAAAEIDPVMSTIQVKAILISLLVSGGMLVTGNIPNIITAAKLKISMKQWAVVGLPIGAIFLAGYYLVLFVLHI